MKSQLGSALIRGVRPILEDDQQGRNIVLVETGAICEYLVERSGGRLGPATFVERLRYRQFLQYPEGSVMPVLFAILVASKVPLLERLAVRRIRPMLEVHLDYMEAELVSRPYFAGDALTAADITMSFPLEAARARAGLSASRPAILAWLDRMHARPAHQEALRKDGPYSFA